MAEESNHKNDTVGLFLRAMVDREPGKRKVKPSKAALIDLAELDLGESSDDSDFNVDEAKLKEDDDISINSDPDDNDDDDDDDEDDDEDDINEEEEVVAKGTNFNKNQHCEKENLSISLLLARAKEKQDLAKGQGIIHPKILVCAICLGEHSDDTNEIVTCDGCHVSVHEGCYGISDTISVSSTVSSSSTEPWFCDACKAGVTNPPCELCPNLGYTIFKETEMGRWVHLVCALYVPGVAFSEVDKLSFPTLFEMPYSKYGAKTCSLCEDERYCKTGVCIGCDAGMCRSYFHVTCAQREGLLSEVNHGEADQADPYYAHCKLHTDRELIRRRKRNWLALQLHMRQGEKEKLSESRKTQDRLVRKLGKYREKYLLTKSNRPTPWFPTQKMPRSLSTCASFFRSLLHKTKLMGIETETSVVEPQALGEVRKKWHIPPAFNVEFISYYLDRTSRLQEMKSRLSFLLQENEDLMKEEASLRSRYNTLSEEARAVELDNNALLNKALEIHDLLKSLAGRPLRLPPVVAALHNPPFVDVHPATIGSGGGTASAGTGKEKRIITKAAAKMMGANIPSMPVGVDNDVGFRSSEKGFSSDSARVMSYHPCSVCHSTKEQHMLIQCDTCNHYYHLSCLDPPLSRMPKKTKQMGWQCSDCCKSSDSDKAPEIDTAAPRRLRRVIKEPSKFSPSVSKDPKTSQDRPADGESKGDSSVKGGSSSIKGPLPPKAGTKRRLSAADDRRGKQKVRRRSLDTPKKGVFCSSPPTLPNSLPSSSSASSSSSATGQCVGGTSLDVSAESLPSPHSESFPSEEDPSCPSRRERRHREGGKKKKKDRDKEEGGRKRKKHHRDRHSLGEMASEMVSPFRIKIKPLPPRPNGLEAVSSPSPVSTRPQPADVVTSHTTSTTTAPPGYPPLPPGYTLTHPMLMPSSQPLNSMQESATGSGSMITNSSSANTSVTITTSLATAISASATTTTANSSVMTTSTATGTRTSIGRRKSDPTTEQFSKCDVCGETGGVTNTVMCDECLKAYHFNCLEPPLKKSPKRRGYSWFCEDCDNASEKK